MQAWWQKKLSIFAGIGGALILMMQSMVATFIWPLYDITRDPLAVLTASDAPYRMAFVTLQIVAAGLILFSLVAVYQQYKSRRLDDIATKLQQVAVAFVIYVGLSLGVPSQMATVAFETGLTAGNVMNTLYVSLIIVTLWRYSQAAFSDSQMSLGNAVQLLAILFGLFHVMVMGVSIIGWPLRGFFDVLALDTLAAAFGFIFWYHGRKTAV